MLPYSEVIAGTSTNVTTPTTEQINQGNNTLTPYNSAVNNGYYRQMSQGIFDLSAEIENVITTAGLTPDSPLTQLLTGLDVLYPRASSLGTASTENTGSAVGNVPLIGTTGYILKSQQIFTSSGTWTKPANINAVIVEVQGGGGGGAGGTANRAGAGAGGYSRKFITSGLGATETITIGAGGAGGTSGNAGSSGGTSSFGSHCSATGGSNSGTGNEAGGDGGVGSSGDINVKGGCGITPAPSTGSGGGGNSFFAGGGDGASGGAGGNASANSGAGGGGASGAFSGGNGAAGIIIVYEYI